MAWKLRVVVGSKSLRKACESEWKEQFDDRLSGHSIKIMESMLQVMKARNAPMRIPRRG
jgi:hypothetical protein